VNDKRERLFHKTSAGRVALELPRSPLPEHYRAILRRTHELTCFEQIAAALPRCSTEQVLGYIDDLEAIGLIESVALEWLLALNVLAANEPRAPMRPSQ
jgi:hypothetical protein